MAKNTIWISRGKVLIGSDHAEKYSPAKSDHKKYVEIVESLDCLLREGYYVMDKSPDTLEGYAFSRFGKPLIYLEEPEHTDNKEAIERHGVQADHAALFRYISIYDSLVGMSKGTRMPFVDDEIMQKASEIYRKSCTGTYSGFDASETPLLEDRFAHLVEVLGKSRGTLNTLSEVGGWWVDFFGRVRDAEFLGPRAHEYFQNSDNRIGVSVGLAHVRYLEPQLRGKPCPPFAPWPENMPAGLQQAKELAYRIEREIFPSR